MPRVATKLTPIQAGGWSARKAIPADIRQAYAKLYGRSREERFNSGVVPILTARAKHREWSNEIESRFANIRAERKGDGRTLTSKEARAVAGEWYHWFVARMGARQWAADVWEGYQHQLHDELYGPAMSRGVFAGDPLELWERDGGMRERVRPMIADWSESAQFLASKRLTLDVPSRDMFLDFVTRDFFAALTLLWRRASGDYGPDKWAERFPQQQGSADASLTPWDLFERWIAEVKPAPSTVGRWRSIFVKLKADFPNDNAASLLPEQMQQWAKELVNNERSAATVRNIWVTACRTIFAWAVGAKHVTRNPFIGWRITVPKKITTRETKAFTDEEIKIILEAATAIDIRSTGRTAGSQSKAAKRWCPWLAAYSGARIGELTQLRGVDIIERDGIHAMKLSPEAGTVKTRKPRTVPLHQHLIEQGFLEFVKASGDGPLFYAESNHRRKAQSDDDPTKPHKPPYVQLRDRMATWVRKLGVSDHELSPNHAWRHTFKAEGFRCGIPEKVLDAIVGHAPASVGRGYGEPTLVDKARELGKFSRYPGARAASHSSSQY